MSNRAAPSDTNRKMIKIIKKLFLNIGPNFTDQMKIMKTTRIKGEGIRRNHGCWSDPAGDHHEEVQRSWISPWVHHSTVVLVPVLCGSDGSSC